MSLDFAFQALVTVAMALGWKRGGVARHWAALGVVTAGIDALVDIPEFLFEGNTPALLAEVAWAWATVLVVRHYWRNHVRLADR